MTISPAMFGTAAAQPAVQFRAPHLKPDASTPEGGIWGLSTEAESHVRSSGELDTDPALTAFVARVVAKLAPEYEGDLRVYVLDRPIFNAMTAPNGYVEVYSGLLLRVMDEDELAFVLGHEISHFARNHTFERWQATKNTSNGMLLITAGITIAAGAASYSVARSGAPNASQTINSISDTARALNDLTYLYGVAGLYAFDRTEETEADKLGFERARAAGYYPNASLNAWSEVIDENHASDFQRVRQSDARASIFSTHPLTVDRVAALKGLSAPAASESDRADARRRYRSVIRPYLAAWLKDDLRRRDYGQTLYLIERLKGVGEDLGVLEFYRGEVFRHRRTTGDDVLALSAYKAAVAHDDAPSEAWRELGDASVKQGDKASAKSAYQKYLDLKPKAEDRWLVEASLKTLGEGGS